MRHQRIIALTLAMLLSACQPSAPPQSLTEKLQGKTLEEKREILRLACLNEAEYSTKIKKAKYRKLHGSKRVHLVEKTPETSRLMTLCWEMSDHYPQKEQ